MQQKPEVQGTGFSCVESTRCKGNSLNLQIGAISHMGVMSKSKGQHRRGPVGRGGPRQWKQPLELAWPQRKATGRCAQLLA